MATCYKCGNEAGYLHSICPDCRAADPHVFPEPIAKAPLKLLRLDSFDRDSPQELWVTAIAWIGGITAFLGIMVVAYVVSTPKYEREANQILRVCLDYVAAADQRHVCQENFERAMQDGRSENERK